MSDYLPPEIVVDILSRLPPKSLLKFRCVCKSWRTLISSSDFIAKHLNRTKSSKLLLVRYLPVRYLSSSTPTSVNEQYLLRFDDDSFDGYAKFKCPFVTNVYFRIVGICNGLICLCDDRFGYSDIVFVWNPSVHRYLSLPKPKVNLLSSSGHYMSALGFGFDSRKNDYKVVKLTYLQKKSQFDRFDIFCDTPIVEIYSVSTCSWRTMKRGVPPVGIVPFFWEQVFLNGSVHWLAYKKDGKVARNVVLSFDMADEKFGVMEFPKVLAHIVPVNFSVGLYKDSLALFVYKEFRKSSTSFEVFVMKEYGVVESWSKMLEVADVEGGISFLPGFREDGELLVVTQGNELVSYDPKSKRTKKLGIRGVKESVYAGAYAESLVLLDGLKGRLSSQVKTYKNSVANKAKRILDESEIDFLLGTRLEYICDAIPTPSFSIGT